MGDDVLTPYWQSPTAAVRSRRNPPESHGEGPRRHTWQKLCPGESSVPPPRHPRLVVWRLASGPGRIVDRSSERASLRCTRTVGTNLVKQMV